MTAPGAIVPGDLVRLKSGGPPMVVENVVSGDVVTCVWFNDGRKFSTYFVVQTLEKAETPEPLRPKKRVQ